MKTRAESFSTFLHQSAGSSKKSMGRQLFNWEQSLLQRLDLPTRTNEQTIAFEALLVFQHATLVSRNVQKAG